MLKKIFLRGPLLSLSGYGVHARLVLSSLLTRPDLFEVYCETTNWGKTSWISQSDPMHNLIVGLLTKTSQYVQSGGRFDVSVQVSIPNEFQRIAPKNIGVTAGIETNKVAPEWLQKCNEMDKVIVVSNFAKEGFKTSYTGKDNQGKDAVLRCLTDIDVIGYPVSDFPAEQSVLDIDLPCDFNFLSVCQWGPRKNLHNLVGWFCEEFKDENVGLVVKTSINNNSMVDKIHCEEQVNSILEKFKDKKCSVTLIHGDMTEQEMNSLYKHPKIKCFATVSFGEGWGLPIFEAAQNELPVIAPDWSGYQDFMYLTTNGKSKTAFAKVNYDLANVQREAVWPGVINEDMLWAFPKQGSFKARLREVYKDYDRFKSQAKKLSVQIRQNFTEQKIHEAYCKSISFSNSVEENVVEL